MDNNGEFIDPQTIIKTGNLPIDKRIKDSTKNRERYS